MAGYFSPLTKNIGIDLGTCSTRVFVEGRGIVLAEPSVLAMDERTGEPLAFGQAAEKLLATAEEHVKLHRPLHNGVIADYNVTYKMLGYLLSKCVRSVQRLRIMVGVPAGASNVEKRAVMEAMYQAGAKEAFVMETGAAAAVGAQLSVAEPAGNMVMDLGGGTTNIAILSLRGIVLSQSLHIGSLSFNQAIREYLQERYAIGADEMTIEDMKISCGAAVLPLEDKNFYFMGRSLANGLQQEASIRASELYAVMGRTLQKILLAARRILQETPPELAADIMDRGIYLTGGGARLTGAATLISQELGVPVRVADNPESAVVCGVGKVIAERNRWEALTEGADRIYKRRF